MNNDVFFIGGDTVKDTLTWATDVAEIDVMHLHSTLVAGGKMCDLCLSLMEYYRDNLAEYQKQIAEGKGDPVINKKRFPLLELGERINNLIGYVTLLQMDATMSLIHMMEAESDSERLLICKHAYSILYDFQDKGLYKVISKAMRELPDELLHKEEIDDLWAEIKQFNRLLMNVNELKDVRNKIDAHKKASFSEQMDAYKQCKFGKCFANLYALMKLAWLFHQAVDIAWRRLLIIEDGFVKEAQETLKRWEAIKRELETMDDKDWVVV